MFLQNWIILLSNQNRYKKLIINSMTIIIDWINKNGLLIQVVNTFALTVITAYYAWQTKSTVRLMSKTEESNSRPKIAIFIAQRENSFNIIDLVVGNYGDGIAKNITFRTNSLLALINEDEKLNDIDIIKNGLPTLAPKQTIKIPLLSVIGRLEDLKKQDIVIYLEYKDFSLKNIYQDEYKISFNSLIDRKIG